MSLEFETWLDELEQDSKSLKVTSSYERDLQKAKSEEDHCV